MDCRKFRGWEDWVKVSKVKFFYAMVVRGDWVRVVKSVDQDQGKSNGWAGFVQAFLTIFWGQCGDWGAWMWG
jgi:hypothetical protein